MRQDTTKQVPETVDELFTIKEVTEKLKISRWTLDKLTEEKGIKTVRIGSSVRYTAKHIAQLIN